LDQDKGALDILKKEKEEKERREREEAEREEARKREEIRKAELEKKRKAGMLCIYVCVCMCYICIGGYVVFQCHCLECGCGGLMWVRCGKTLIALFVLGGVQMRRRGSRRSSADRWRQNAGMYLLKDS
jgi:hypothetical protein